jgi:hypothetical protein
VACDAEYDCGTKNAEYMFAAGLFASAFFTALTLYIAANIIELLFRIELALNPRTDSPPIE